LTEDEEEMLLSLARVVGDEAQEGEGFVPFYMRCCQALIEADLAWIDREHLEEFVYQAFQRRQDRFPRTPILNAAGVYATSWSAARAGR
jgi:hypothetical protein